jgi:hypothetical protein
MANVKLGETGVGAPDNSSCQYVIFYDPWSLLMVLVVSLVIHQHEIQTGVGIHCNTRGYFYKLSWAVEGRSRAGRGWVCRRRSQVQNLNDRGHHTSGMKISPMFEYPANPSQHDTPRRDQIAAITRMRRARTRTQVR